MLKLLENYHGDEETRRQVVDAYERLERDPVLGYLARYEHGRALYGVGDFAKAREVLTEWYNDTLDAGVLPRIDSDFHTIFNHEDNEHWRALSKDLSTTLTPEG